MLFCRCFPTCNIVLSTLFCIHDLTHVCDWLVLLSDSIEKEHAIPYLQSHMRAIFNSQLQIFWHHGALTLSDNRVCFFPPLLIELHEINEVWKHIQPASLQYLPSRTSECLYMLYLIMKWLMRKKCYMLLERVHLEPKVLYHWSMLKIINIVCVEMNGEKYLTGPIPTLSLKCNK